MKNIPSVRLVGKVASRQVLDKNIVAFKTYDVYKKTANIIERAEFASGKTVVLRSGTGSTLNFEINRDGVCSTTA